MARRTSKPKEGLQPPNLVESREAARQKIQFQIEKGQQYRERSIHSEKELEDLRAERRKWSDYNLELLQRLFDTPVIADEYNNAGVDIIPLNPSLRKQIEYFHRSVDSRITCLESIRDRLELITESSHPCHSKPRCIYSSWTRRRSERSCRKISRKAWIKSYHPT